MGVARRLLANTVDEIDTLRATRGMTLHHPRIMELLDERRRADAKLARQNDLDRQTAAANQALGGTVAVDASPVVIPSPWNAERARVETRLAALQSKLREVALDIKQN